METRSTAPAVPFVSVVTRKGLDGLAMYALSQSWHGVLSRAAFQIRSWRGAARQSRLVAASSGLLGSVPAGQSWLALALYRPARNDSIRQFG